MKEVLKAVSKPIEQEKMNTGIKQRKEVWQLDPKILEVVKKWESISNARKELGAVNINRAISDVTKAGGFYWTYPEELDKMIQAIRDKWGRKRKKAVNRPASEYKSEKPKEAHPKPSDMITLGNFTDNELMAELKLRGYTGSLSITKTVEL